MNELLDNIKIDALNEQVPIIQDASLEVIGSLIDQYQMKKILEIGTAVAYSALAFLEHDSVLQVDTFERNPERSNFCIEEQL